MQAEIAWNREIGSWSNIAHFRRNWAQCKGAGFFQGAVESDGLWLTGLDSIPPNTCRRDASTTRIGCSSSIPCPPPQQIALLLSKGEAQSDDLCAFAMGQL